MLIIKKLTKQCAPCPSASIMILQKGIAIISFERGHLVLTPLTSILKILNIKKLHELTAEKLSRKDERWTNLTGFC